MICVSTAGVKDSGNGVLLCHIAWPATCVATRGSTRYARITSEG